MTNIDRDIQNKKAEIAIISEMLENAKRDLRRLEKQKEKESHK